MITIHKYELVTGFNSIALHTGAKILDVHGQHGKLCVWAEVDTSKKGAVKEFHVFATGHEIPNKDELKYIGTAHMDNGYLVWHVYIKK